MTDERRNRPSASSIELYSQCRGAWLLSQKVPESERFTNADSVRGTLLHKADEEGTVEGLELSDADFLVEARRIEERLYLQWVQDFEITEAPIIRERRWWLRDGFGGCSGQLDFVALAEPQGHALILDLKSGRKPVTPPIRNWQLRTGVVMLATNHGVSNVRVGIVAPYMKSQPLADYDGPAIFSSAAQLDSLLEEIENPDAPRTAGAWCDRCPARHICPEALAVANKVLALDGLRWRILTPERKLELFQICKSAQAIIDAVAENVKAELKTDPTSIPGLIMTKPTHPRAIRDAVKLYLTLENEFPDVDVNLVNDAYNRMIKIKVGELETFFREVRGGTKTDATAWVSKACGTFLTTTTREGHVEFEK